MVALVVVEWILGAARSILRHSHERNSQTDVQGRKGQIGHNHRQMQKSSFIGAYLAGAPGTRRVRITIRCSWSDSCHSPVCATSSPKLGIHIASQLNFSLGCLLCGAAVAQSLDRLGNQMPQTFTCVYGRQAWWQFSSTENSRCVARITPNSTRS